MNRNTSSKFHGLHLILPLLLLLPVRGYTQYYSIGADPSAIKWSQTNVHQFHLIYPEKEFGIAGKYAAILSDLGVSITASMQSDIRTLPIILHPDAAFSNGSSILAPRRMELFPKQPIALETNDFSSQLIIHEMRHFAQMERLNTGFTKVAGFFLGEQAQSVVLGLHVPKWLLEGDAVLAETLLSDAGRGRMAGFIQPLRSRLVDNKDLSWDRVWFGSYHEILPDEYLFGYFLTARGRMLADPLLWSDAIGQIGRNPFNIKGISGITRPKTGFRFSKLYVETLEWLHDFWTNPVLAVNVPDSLLTIAGDSPEYRNYYRPQQFSVHEVICLRKTLWNLPAFVIIDSSGNERVIVRPGTMEDAGFSYHQGKLVWAELIRDPRWENRSWSELFSYEFTTGRKIRLTHGKRYFSPVFSPSGERIAVIDEQVDGSSYIRIIDPLNGHVVISVQGAISDHFSYICWGNGPNELYAVTTGSEGRKLVRIGLGDQVRETILKAGFTDIACPAVYGNWIYFTGPAGATQGLYRISRKSNSTEMVFRHPHGINYLNTQNKDLFLSVYTSNGYRPAKIPFSSLHGKFVNRIGPLIEPVTSIIQRADGEFPIVYSDTVRKGEIKPYRKIAHLFRLHSWSPLFINPDSYQISPGVVLMSQNDLSTLTCWAGYQYNKTDLSHNLLASLRYTGFYPVLEMDYIRKYMNPAMVSDSAGNHLTRFPAANSQVLRLETGLPFNFSSGSWNRLIEPSVFFQQVRDLSVENEEFDLSAWMTGISVSAALLRKTSYRDLFPRWGASVNFRYYLAYSQGSCGNNVTGRFILYLPGFLPNSSLRVLNSASLLTTYQFLDFMPDYPRGQVVSHARDQYNLKIDYAFPVMYPDYHLSWLIYIKRIKADAFFDAGCSLDEKNWFTSAGLDLTMDYYLLRLGLKLESGIRLMYFPATRKIGAEFLFAFAVN